MSYARSPYEGDVYVIGTIHKRGSEKHWECMHCSILPAILVHGKEWTEEGGLAETIDQHWQRQIFTAESPGQMLTHLRLHRAAGETVPERALTLLMEEHVEWAFERRRKLDELTAMAEQAWEQRS